MSSPCDSGISGRFRTWKFSHTLHTSLDSSASRSFASSMLISYESVGAHIAALQASLKQLLVSLLAQHKPSQITSIELRVPRTTINACVSNARSMSSLPDLPLEGYIQATTKINHHSLKSWIDATWERVGGKLNAHQPYLKDFLAPDEDTLAAYVYFQLHGEPALSKGGRPRKPPAVNYSSACLDNSHAAYAPDVHATCLIVLRPNPPIALTLSSHGKCGLPCYHSFLCLANDFRRARRHFRWRCLLLLEWPAVRNLPRQLRCGPARRPPCARPPARPPARSLARHGYTYELVPGGRALHSQP